MRTILPILLVGLLGCFFGGKPELAGLGPVKLDSLCNDLSRCDARGDVAVSALEGRKPAPIHLADGQGVESYLGKVAPERKAQGVLRTCGGDVSRDDWLETGPSVRVVELPAEGKLQLRAALKASVARGLLARNAALSPDIDVEALSEAAVRQLALQKISMVSQTYWLKDAAFERRVGQCGEEEYANIIYSLTLLQLSELTRKELESKLVAGLESELGAPPPAVPAAPPPPEATLARPTAIAPTGIPDANAAVPPAAVGAPAVPGEQGAPPPPLDPEVRRKLLRELGFDAVRDLASELRMIAALGFDEA